MGSVQAGPVRQPHHVTRKLEPTTVVGSLTECEPRSHALKLTRATAVQMTRSLSVALITVFLLGCGAAEGELGHKTQQWDSAGVMIAETSGPIWGEPPTWTTSPEPSVSVGALEGRPEYLLSRVFSAALLSDGTIVVADGGSSSLRWYDASGTFLFERGGRGEGPGEFGRIGSVVRAAADTLVVTDGSLRRISEYTSSGDLVGTRQIEGVVVPGAAEPLSDGTFIVGAVGFSSRQLTGEEEGMERTLEPLLRIGVGLEGPDTLGMFPGPEIYFTKNSFGFHPFGRAFNYAVRGDIVFVAAAEGFVVDVYSAEGALVRSIRAPEVDLRLTPESIAEYQQGVRESVSDLDESVAKEVVDRAEGMPFPDDRPAYGRFLAGDETLWLEEHTAGQTEGPSRWAVFGHDGEYRGTAALPAGFRLLGVSRDRVLGVWTDDLGVEYVRVHELVESDL